MKSLIDEAIASLSSATPAHEVERFQRALSAALDVAESATLHYDTGDSVVETRLVNALRDAFGLPILQPRVRR